MILVRFFASFGYHFSIMVNFCREFEWQKLKKNREKSLKNHQKSWFFVFPDGFWSLRISESRPWGDPNASRILS